ncbi:MAG: hypothetical protein U0132_11130 [Gemmatimonadaceae bacterium]
MTGRHLALLTLAMVALPVVAQSQYRGVRFEITRVGDSTFAFSVGAEKWIKAGQTGIAVDPKRRDALVARFTVARIAGGEASVLVVGQTTNVRTDHVAILEEPRRAWYKQRSFWVGVLAGSALGAGVGFAR